MLMTGFLIMCVGFTNNRSETRENAFWVLLLRFSGKFDHICICRGFSFVHK